LDEFRRELASLAERIRAVLPSKQKAVSEGEVYVPDRKKLLKLKMALEAERVREADNMLEELEKRPLAKETKMALDAAAAHVLLSEWREAAGVIADLLEDVCENEA
jgi:hypothetical protein